MWAAKAKLFPYAYNPTQHCKLSTYNKGLSLVALMFLIAIICVSVKISNENVDNPFCFNKYDKDAKIELEYDEIEDYTYYFKCSTLYIEMVVTEDLTKLQITSLLLSIGNDLNKYDCFTHLQIDSDSLEKTLYATINLKTNEVSYVG